MSTAASDNSPKSEPVAPFVVSPEEGRPVAHLQWLQRAVYPMVESDELSTDAGKLAGLLAPYFDNTTRDCRKGDRALHRLFGCRPATLRRARQELVAAGLLEVEVGTERTATTYRRSAAPATHPRRTKSAPAPNHVTHPAPNQVHAPSAPRLTTSRGTSSYLSERLTAGAEGARRTSHETLDEVEAGRRLRKAVGRQWADLALEEVEARIAHGEPVLSKPGLARELAECYRGNCRKPGHSELHGAEAVAYHAARRRDWAQEVRAKAARTRGPTSALADDDDLEERRRRQIDQLEEGEPTVIDLTDKPAFDPEEIAAAEAQVEEWRREAGARAVATEEPKAADQLAGVRCWLGWFRGPLAVRLVRWERTRVSGAPWCAPCRADDHTFDDRLQHPDEWVISARAALEIKPMEARR
jgi:hypothetical protein